MKEQLETRLADLRRAIDQSTANHNALVGRAAEIEHLLNELNKEDKPEIVEQ